MKSSASRTLNVFFFLDSRQSTIVSFAFDRRWLFATLFWFRGSITFAAETNELSACGSLSFGPISKKLKQGRERERENGFRLQK